MNTLFRRKPASLTGSGGTSSSTATRASSSTEGSYYSTGSGSTYHTHEDRHTGSTLSSSQVRSSTTSSKPSAGASDRTPTLSAVSSLRGNANIASPFNLVSSSPASSSDAIVKVRTTKGRGQATAVGATLSTLSSSAAIATATTSNGVTIDATDALVQKPSSSQQHPQGSASVTGSSVSSSSKRLTIRADDTLAQQRRKCSLAVQASRSVESPAPASPYHFSEEELALHPWPIEGDATTHTSEEGGHATRAADVLETIHTIPIEVPPSPAEAQRCCREGGLPYPSHLTFRIIPGAAGASSDGAGGGAVASGAATKGSEGKAKLTRDGAQPNAAGPVKKTTCSACCGAYFRRKREEELRKVEERAAARQRSYRAQLRSHHVPLVNFRTMRDSAVNLMDGDNTVPTVEEAAGYRHYEEHMQGTEANPKKLEEAMRQHSRPMSGLHWKTKYAFGRRAGGGPRGVGESAFAREGDPQRYWIAQLHEQPQVHLEPIETS
ncbi:hypothetical protein ABL78_6441 [Leptomonas seymouri]|uniref:Uncharacterized protein n=1 Tax=Leptomonas seymouri TaxID=5684 RepID=A0A0N0P3T5_LEPSE|nr:hypothetical protein ABL78_6441 [Leptomonas seymouri]|eukprot:KPI84506.1 hypothetical protein ABL78_6441 [Leptomonas seymouri]